ncbi:hypothetical protein OVA24_00860 [Luteolibacter sp. SL250]|uniref:hypothetical protein n=1 Tax=Luteolibacter sp. SL250 TaxID=2995170 RepID=UPI0022715A04|nr:hypothetical protein [Luteolibacter sp. SL250]WAC19927.1 hypothetical protein OVA24_00860 [Luteolibacter sp. SL250]
MIHEPSQSDPAPQGEGNAAVAWFRVFVWLMPTAFVAGLAMLVAWVFISLAKRGGFNGSQGAEGFVIVLWMVGSMVGVLGLGHLDARLKRHQQKISREDDRFDDGWHVLKFFLLQILVVPCLVFVVVVVIGMMARAVRL